MTIAKQVYKQWHEGTSEGVSKWLFLGQIAASVGFGSADVFRRRFERRFGIAPKIYRARFLSARQIEVSRIRTTETTL